MFDKLFEFNTHDFYTDGACSQNTTQDGGYAFTYWLDDEEKHFFKQGQKNTTNNEMELKAFLSALEYAAENLPQEKIRIHTDSAYISNCFNQKWYERWELNGWKNARRQPVAHSQIWEKILKEYRVREKENLIEIVKVKGHADNAGNIRADYLAGLGKEEAANE